VASWTVAVRSPPCPTMSHHFRVLRDAGLVQTQTIGTTHMNSLRREDLSHRFPGLLETILSQYDEKGR